MENTKNDMLRICTKIDLNYFYKGKCSNVFHLYDENEALKITEQGKRNLKYIEETIKKRCKQIDLM